LTIDDSTRAAGSLVHTDQRTWGCSGLRAECSSDPIPAGEYAIRYAEAEAPLTIPSTGPPICFEGVPGSVGLAE
jgi:hypothetical protein